MSAWFEIDKDGLAAILERRGKAFKWFGLDCELVVSPFDMRRNGRLRIEREQMAAV